ncbi:MAG: anthranilate synthase component I family protein [Victivallaceae bacterium]|nr:anthranilate synthase component I family protein [Victivallaceae bacterium]
MLSFEEFKKLAAEYELIPVHRKFIADAETPVSMLAKFTEEDAVFLLESVETPERFGRYSFLGLNPRGLFTIEYGKAYLADAAGKRELASPSGRPLDALRQFVEVHKVYAPPELPPLFGGAVGFLGYETVNQFEKLPLPAEAPEQPESAFMLTDEVIVFDNQQHAISVVVCVRPGEYPTAVAAYEDAAARIEAIYHRAAAPAHAPEAKKCAMPELVAVTGREKYMHMVEKAREYIRQGEAIQVVLSQKFQADLTVEPLSLYRALRAINPSPYTFFMKFPGVTLIGSSPETLCKLENHVAILRPIAGTRPRGKDAAADRAFADEMLNSEKERAEHLMLVDLGRNDLGRIALSGSVQLKEFMTVERYSHVMHLVSSIEALPREGVGPFELLRSAFPAGTLSGAPKVRAMELIHELEGSPRNAYGGAAGYFSYSGNMDLAITIRTLSIHDGKITVQVGAGIVFDSDPAAENEECRNKSAAIRKAIELAANGLDLNSLEK